MAIALLGYFMTMVGALAGLMLVLNMCFTLAPTEKTRVEPHLRPAIAQRAEPAGNVGQWGRSPAARPAEVVADSTTAAASKSAMDRHAAAAARAAAKKTKWLKIARLRKQKMLARQRQEEESTTAALGYAQEPSYSPPFNPFGTRF